MSSQSPLMTINGCNFTTTLHKKKPWAKTLLSIGGGGSNSSAFAAIAANPSLRATFIASTINVARTYGFDGLDLDWEFPATQQDMSNLATLFVEWRTAVDKESVTSSRPRLLLSAAVYFASNFFLSSTPRAFPADSINKNLDFVNAMCYDYRGSWDTSATGAHALLYDRTSNISTSYGVGSWIRAGVGSRKVVMGLPLYGRTWQLKDPTAHGIAAPAVGVGPGPEGVLTFREIVDFNGRNNATTVYDADTVSTYSFAGNAWIGYDGVWSVRRKVRYAKAHRLGGYFFWALGYDKEWTLSKTASVAWNN
ncbi:hypothetical protein Scep_023798 [Stephania cephalantha]|uniref:GH18 domain-containing protein n=1 Tax=Stephania cephalantha TaxID=152367 RepID=A0AAP0F0T4_9MAGN